MAVKSSSVKKAIKSGIKKKGNQQPTAGDPIISRVRELAWEGKHEQAIKLATEALNASGLKPGQHMDLLDLRAESYLALLNIEAAEKDVSQMERLAKAINKPAWKSKALIRKTQLRA